MFIPGDVSSVTPRLVAEAKRRGSSDNITAIVVFLKPVHLIAKDYRSIMDASSSKPVDEQVGNGELPVSLNADGVNMVQMEVIANQKPIPPPSNGSHDENENWFRPNSRNQNVAPVAEKLVDSADENRQNISNSPADEAAVSEAQRNHKINN